MAVVIPILIFMVINDMRQLKCVPKNAPNVKRTTCMRNGKVQPLKAVNLDLPIRVVANNPNA